jgi:hypothetical protein
MKYFTFNREVFKTKLFKLLFYSDFINYKKFKSSITGLEYAHLPRGPVPDNYLMVLGTILKNSPSLILQTKILGKREGEVIFCNSTPDLSIFSELELGIIKKINSQFKYFTSADLTDSSHQEAGYKETSTGQLIPYSYAEEIKVDI